MIFLVVLLVILILNFFLQFKIAQKLGHPHSWFAFVPILQMIQFLQLGGYRGWWILSFLIPILPMIIFFHAGVKIARRCGQRGVFAILMFIPVLGLLAMWKLWKTRVVFVPEPGEAAVVNQVAAMLAENVDVAQIQQQANEQNIDPEKFERILQYARAVQSSGNAATGDGASVLGKGAIWGIFLFLVLGLPAAGAAAFYFLNPSDMMSKIIARMILGSVTIESSPIISTSRPAPASSRNSLTVQSSNFEPTKASDISVIFPEKPEEVERLGEKRWKYQLELRNKVNGNLFVLSSRKTPRGGGGGTYYFKGKLKKDIYDELEIKSVVFGKPNYGEFDWKLDFYDCTQIEGDCESFVRQSKPEPIKTFQKRFSYQAGMDAPEEILENSPDPQNIKDDSAFETTERTDILLDFPDRPWDVPEENPENNWNFNYILQNRVNGKLAVYISEKSPNERKEKMIYLQGSQKQNFTFPVQAVQGNWILDLKFYDCQTVPADQNCKTYFIRNQDKPLKTYRREIKFHPNNGAPQIWGISGKSVQ